MADTCRKTGKTRSVCKTFLKKSHWRKPLEHVLEKNVNRVIGEIKCNITNFVQITD
jgi:hypothetical protein